MRLASIIAGVAVLASGCQPWYRDAARGGRRVLDDGLTTTELREASTARQVGHADRAAAILDGAVHRNPKVRAEVWLALVDAEVAAGQVDRARAHARWELARLAAGDPDAARLRAFLIGSLAAAGLVAPALELVEPQTLEAARAFPALAARIDELAIAVRQRDPELARLRLGGWLARYGEPDHPILRDARAQIATALWTAARSPDAPPAVAAMRAQPGLVRDELAAGRVESALIAYGEARPFLPDDIVAALARELAPVVAAAKITSLTPDVHARAVDADAAVRRGELGAAIAHYRAVVLRAPWWTAARHNLDALNATRP